jgi:hypothetical protein
VVGRAFCRFSRFDLKTVPVKRRKQALQLQLNQWSPFAKPEFAIVFEEHAALVWCWDGNWLQMQKTELPQQWHQAHAIPESALFSPLENGVRLISCLDGVEAQFWKNNELHASRWWQQSPELDDFIAFCREVGHPVATLDQLPQVQNLNSQAQPWLPVKFGDQLGSTYPAIEQWLYAALFIGVALPYGWYSLRQQQVSRATTQSRLEMTKLTKQANVLIQARQSAMAALDEMNSRLQLAPYPSQLELMSAFSDVLLGDSSIREWEFKDGKLRVVIVAGLEMPSRADITSAILKTGRFSEVQNLLARDATNLAFRMTVLPRQGVISSQDNRTADEKERK